MPETSFVPSWRQADTEVQTLGPADALEVQRLVAGRRFSCGILAAELANPDRYRWVGARRPDGRLVAVHRAMRWGGYKFLKGVFVDPEDRGGDNALRLAFALREAARHEDVWGIAAWMSESSPAQLALARRLRLERTGEPLHIYTIPFRASTGCEPTLRRPLRSAQAAHLVEEILARHHAEQVEPPLVPDLLLRSGSHHNLGVPMTCRAIADRNRLLLSSLPCANADQLCALLRELAPAATALELSEVEFPVPAAAITLALWLSGHDAQRISTRPVHVGRSEFTPAKKDQS